MSDSDSDKKPEGRVVNGHRVSRTTTTTTTTMAVSVAAEESSQATTTDHLRLWDGQRHQRFMDAMDSLPEDCTELEWIMRLAEKLQWEPGEVALHAFRYFLALNEYYLQEERDEAYREGNKKPSNQWTEEEAILFDTLCAVYMQESTGPPNERDWYWVVQISSFFPGRSPDYLWEKYKGIRGERNGEHGEKKPRAC